MRATGVVNVDRAEVCRPSQNGLKKKCPQFLSGGAGSKQHIRNTIFEHIEYNNNTLNVETQVNRTLFFTKKTLRAVGFVNLG